MLSLGMWIEEGFAEAEAEMKKESQLRKKEKQPSCSCEQTVCCGKHKNGQCSCHRGKERD